MLPVRGSNGSLASLDAPGNRLSVMFDRFFNDDIFSPLTTPSLPAMPLSMWEDEDHFYVEVDAPGVTEKDIDISVHAGDLIIRGERRSERQGNGYDTRSYGRFEQRLCLPSSIQTQDVDAKLANGVLSLTFTKSEEAKPRKIALKSK